MKNHKIVVNKGDKCITDLIIERKLEEGWYEYIPYDGDEITVTFRDCNGEVKSSNTYEVSGNNTERITIDMPSELDAGEYTYDVVLKTAEGEVHTMCQHNIFIIREVKTHEEHL